MQRTVLFATLALASGLALAQNVAVVNGKPVAIAAEVGPGNQRVTLAAERLNNLDELLKLTVRARDGTLVPLSELVEVSSGIAEKTIYHKDLLPVVYVFGDMAGKLDSHPGTLATGRWQPRSCVPRLPTYQTRHRRTARLGPITILHSLLVFC